MKTKSNTMRERREAIEGVLTYTDGKSAGKAHWMDASRDGAKVRLNRYLVPGREVRLHFTGKNGAGHAAISARVVWCTQLPGTMDFTAGLAVRRNEPAPALAFASLRETAMNMNETENERVRLPRWAVLETAGESGNSVTAGNALQHAI